MRKGVLQVPLGGEEGLGPYTRLFTRGKIKPLEHVPRKESPKPLRPPSTSPNLSQCSSLGARSSQLSLGAQSALELLPKHSPLAPPSWLQSFPHVFLSSGASQSLGEGSSDGCRSGTFRLDFRVGGFLPLAARPVLPCRTATAKRALQLADGCCYWLVMIGRG